MFQIKKNSQVLHFKIWILNGQNYNFIPKYPIVQNCYIATLIRDKLNNIIIIYLNHQNFFPSICFQCHFSMSRISQIIIFGLKLQLGIFIFFKVFQTKFAISNFFQILPILLNYLNISIIKKKLNKKSSFNENVHLISNCPILCCVPYIHNLPYRINSDIEIENIIKTFNSIKKDFIKFKRKRITIIKMGFNESFETFKLNIKR